MTNPYATAALPAYASAAIHVLVLPFAPGSETLPMILGTLMWVGLGYGLSQGSRIVAFVSFLAGLFGGVYALSAFLTYTGLASLLFGAMWIADWLVVAFLFLPLWRSAQQSA